MNGVWKKVYSKMSCDEGVFVLLYFFMWWFIGVICFMGIIFTGDMAGLLRELLFIELMDFLLELFFEL